MLKRGEQLTAALVAAGLPVVGVAAPAAVHPTGSPATFHARAVAPLLVRVDWSQQPAAPQTARADAIVLAFDDTARILEEAIDDPRIIGRQQRAVAALIVRASDRWAPLSAARKARVMAVINSAADTIIDALTGSS